MRELSNKQAFARILADAPFATRWAQQYGVARPLAARLSARRALHDRLILVDGTLAWSLT